MSAINFDTRLLNTCNDMANWLNRSKKRNEISRQVNADGSLMEIKMERLAGGEAKIFIDGLACKFATGNLNSLNEALGMLLGRDMKPAEAEVMRGVKARLHRWPATVLPLERLKDKYNKFLECQKECQEKFGMGETEFKFQLREHKYHPGAISNDASELIGKAHEFMEQAFELENEIEAKFGINMYQKDASSNNIAQKLSRLEDKLNELKFPDKTKITESEI